MKRSILCAVTFWTLVGPLVTAPAHAGITAGVEMPDSVHFGQGQLRLNGMALYRKFLIRVLVGGLYLRETRRDEAAILGADAPRRLVMHFLRNVGADKIHEAWGKGLDDNAPEAGEEVRAQFRTLGSWLRDFHRGDEITVTYWPEEGSTVEINGMPVGVLKGKGFADAYFSLALGPKPSLGKKFKRRLLGN
jgi:hypothetical protein